MPSEPIDNFFRVCPTDHQDEEEDPLGILGRGPHKMVGVGNSLSSFNTETAYGKGPTPAVPCCSKTNPTDFIAAMLRRSKHVRDEVSSRQVSESVVPKW